ncbi:hypothetical protein Hdeb2414_s0020g00553931 [Helianthus debilis subsp. tardiflorus]
MAEPSNPLSTTVENPEPSSQVTAEEDGAEVNAPGKNLSVLKWSNSAFQTLLVDTQMHPEYGAVYPQEGDTAGDAPAGYVTMFADFFGDCNLWLPLTVFLAEILEYYKLHIAQISSLGMFRVRNFEYTFCALGIEPMVEDFRRFYQLSVSMGFFSFRQRDHTPKLMIPPKGMTKWKTKFFYVKVAAITAKLLFRNVTRMIITENVSVPTADTVDWFSILRIIGWVKLDNRQLWVLRMMIGRLSRNARPVLQEKSGGDLSDKCQRKTKKPQEAVVVPPLVPEVAGIPRTRLCKYDDYVVVSGTLEGLGVPGGSAAAGGSTAGAEPVDVKKRKGDTAVASGQKAPKLRKTRATAVPKPKPSVTTSKLVNPVRNLSLFLPPLLPLRKKWKFRRRVKTVLLLKWLEMIVDTLDSTNNLIDPHEDDGNRGEKPNSPEKTSGSTTASKRGEDQPSIQPGETELEFYYRSYASEEFWGVCGTPFEAAWASGLPRQNRINQLSSMLVGSSIIAHAIMEDYNVLALKEEETIRLRSEAEAIVKGAREGAEQLEKDKAAFEKLKRTETWVASAGLKQEKAAVEAAAKEAEVRSAKALRDAESNRIKLKKVMEELKVEVQNRVTIIEEVSASTTEA